MKNKLKIRKEENLYEWVKRLSEDALWSHLEPEEIFEILREVSLESYMQGSDAAFRSIKQKH